MPVIVGVGQAIDRPADLEKSLSPIDLIARATDMAERDAGAKLVSAVDSVDVVKHVSAPYEDLPSLTTSALGVRPRRAVITDGSGNGPLREVQNAALKIQSGESDIALICGAEAQWSVDRARKNGVTLPWMPEKAPAPLFAAQPYANPLAVKYGLVAPADVYPLYENATTAAWGQTPAEARRESALIWSRMSEVAAANPFAWLGQQTEPDVIAEATASNRPLAWPYLKLMVALPSVNLGSATIVTSLGRARSLGIAADRMVFIHCGAAAREPDDYVMRDRYDSNASQTAVLKSILAQMGWTTSKFDFVDLYSCFPVVPKMARRLLGLGEDASLTAAGGLTFFGAPVHNYMSHAIAAMVGSLRSAPASFGLLYGQGGFVTKHHALVLSASRPSALLPEDYSVQKEADAARGPVPQLVTHEGPARIETFTVLHDRNGKPKAGIVVARTEDGRRALATVPPEDEAMIGFLKRMDRSPVGEIVKLETREGLSRCLFR
jgi:acetyl-CoA acetyltransferase